jgi:hypothetical protein
MKRESFTLVATCLLALVCTIPLARAQSHYDPYADSASVYAYQSYTHTVYDPVHGSYSVQYHAPAPQAQYQQYGGHVPQGASQPYAYPDANSYRAPQSYAAPAAASAATAQRRTSARVAKSQNRRPYPHQAAAAPAARPVQMTQQRPSTTQYVSMPSSRGYPYQQGAFCPPGRA